MFGILKALTKRKQKIRKLTKSSGNQIRSDHSLFSQIYQYFTLSLIWLNFCMVARTLHTN